MHEPHIEAIWNEARGERKPKASVVAAAVDLYHFASTLNAVLNEFMADRGVESAIIALDQDGKDRWGALCQMLDESSAVLNKANP